MFFSQKIGGVMKVALVITALLLVPGLVLGGTTGRIKGKFWFKDTHGGAAGAFGVMEGPPYGVAADPDGGYLILNIPAGVYTVKSSLVGYHAPSVSNVRVNPDLTTELNFELVAQDINLPAVEIMAQRPLVNKSATNAVRILNADDLSAIPVRGLTG